MSQTVLVELTAPWFAEGIHRHRFEAMDAPDAIRPVDDTASPATRGRYVRTGTAPDGVPVYGWQWDQDEEPR